MDETISITVLVSADEIAGMIEDQIATLGTTWKGGYKKHAGMSRKERMTMEIERLIYLLSLLPADFPTDWGS